MAMTYHIRNLTRRPVSLQLNNGSMLHLAPMMTHPGVPGAELKRSADADEFNTYVEKLCARRIIAVDPVLHSGDLSAEKAIEHIETTPAQALKGFLSDDEDRVTVKRAWDKKHGAA